MGVDTVVRGAPTAAECFGTEGLILDAKNNVLYSFGDSRTPAALVPAAGTLPLTGQTTATTVGAAGAAAALPATPTGYLEISINGTVYKIPYYAV